MKAATEQRESIKKLQEALKPGDTVYTILRHVSASKMRCCIDLYVIRDNKPMWIAYQAAKALKWSFNEKHESINVSGCGMDMGFHLVYSLAKKLFDDGYALEQKWL